MPQLLLRCNGCGEGLAVEEPAADISYECPRCRQPVLASKSGIAVTCPACQHAFKTSTELAGQLIICLGCQRQILVPAATGDAKRKLSLRRETSPIQAQPSSEQTIPNWQTGSRVQTQVTTAETSSRRRFTISKEIIVLAVLIVIGAGYWIYSHNQKLRARKAVEQLLADANSYTEQNPTGYDQAIERYRKATAEASKQKLSSLQSQAEAKIKDLEGRREAARQTATETQQIKQTEAQRNSDEETFQEALKVLKLPQSSQNSARAAGLLQKAAMNGHAQAQYLLGRMFIAGTGVRVNLAAAGTWIGKSAQQQYPPAQASLGVMYLLGYGVSKDQGMALQYLTRAAEQGEPTAQCSLGRMYRRGIGVQQDPAKAVQWLRKAADQGDPQGLLLLGVMYQQGEGVEQNLEKGFESLLQSAQKGNVEAECLVGIAYVEGLGVSRDKLTAQAWLRRAAGSGSVEARNLLSTLR